MALFNISQLVNNTDFGLTVNTIPIYSAQDFYTFVRTRYGHMLFETPETEIEKARQDLKNVYDMWVRLNGEEYLRIYNVMRSEYNPLENYDRMEEGSTETARHKGSRTSQNVDITNTPTVTTKTTEKVNASDGGIVESMETETANTSGNTVTSGSAETNYTETRDISDSVYDRDVETFNGRRTHGNIGITTTQTLITEELNLRLLGFIETIISQFIEKFTFYVSGV